MPKDLFADAQQTGPKDLFADAQLSVSSNPDYQAYLDAVNQENSKAQIPGTPRQSIMSEEEWRKVQLSKNPNLLNLVRSGVEQGLNLAGGIGAQLVAPIGAGLNKLNGGEFEPAYSKLLESGSSLGTQLLNATGQNTDFTENVGQGVQNLMASAPALAAHVPTAGGLLPGRASAIKAALTSERPIEAPVPTKGPVDLFAERQKAIEQEKAQAANNPGAAAFQNVVDSQLTGWNEPIRNNAPNPNGVMPSMVDQLQLLRQQEAQKAIEARQAEMQQQVARQTSLDMNAAERARQEQAPVPGMEQARQAELARQAAETEASIAKTQELNRRGQQMTIQEDYGNNAPMSRMPNMRVDENGIPIRADLSMEVQNLQNPLQRNLWGDELPVRTGDNGIPLTQALDSMPKGPERDAAIAQLSHDVVADFSFPETPSSGTGSPSLNSGFGGGQRGAINRDLLWGPTRVIERSLDKFNEAWKGLTLNAVTGNNRFGIIIKNEKGEQVGMLVASPKDGNLEVGNVHVDTGYRNKGLADLMYTALNKLGNDVVRSDTQLPDGKAMWDRWEQTGKASNGIRASQHGALNVKDIADGIASLFGKSGTLPTKSNPVPIPKQDTLLTPISPENIKKKQDLSDKANAVGIKNSSYSRVTTREEALSDLENQKDMSRFSPNSLRSGIEAVVRTNTNNKVLNYARNMIQEGQNAFERLSKQYVTNPKTGLVATVRALSPKEKSGLADVLYALQRNPEVSITKENIGELGLSKAQEAAYFSIREALDARLGTAHSAMLEMGMEPFKPKPNYIPASFSGAYTSFMGKYVKDANGEKKFVTTGVAQADTAYGLKKAVEKYKSMGEEYAVEMPANRRGLAKNTYNTNNAYNGFNDLIKQLADSDPAFAKAKAIVDQHVVDEVHSLYRFDVHELKKSGVKGSIGDRPWLSAAENAKDLFESIVNYTEAGFHYDSMQKPLAEMKALQAEPALQEKMPNTLNYLNDLDKHLSGKGLNIFGAAMNTALDSAFKSVGLGPSIPRAALQKWQGLSYALMTNITNLGFSLMQLSQLALSGPIEIARIRAEYGIHPMDAATSLPSALMHTSLLTALGDKYKGAPQHMVDAYKWAHDNGIFDYSEAQLAHDIGKSNKEILANKVINASTIYSEKATRGPLFMTYADLFHKAGLRGEDALLRAQEASNYSMTNYSKEARPMIYESLGEFGKLMGALATYKHNFAEQTVSSALNAKRYPAAAGAMLALVYGVYGVSGLPGYQDADKAVQHVTGKSIREYLLQNPDKPNTLLDGALSAKSNIDIQTRVTNSSLLPDGAMQAMPHVSNFFRILGAGYKFATEQDEASKKAFLQAALPAGVRNWWEDSALVDSNGMPHNTKGEVSAERPRTENERTLRTLLGLKPLDERINQELEYSRKQGFKMSEQKIKDLQSRLNRQVINGESVSDTLKEMVALGADQQTVLQAAVKAREEAAKTPRTRDSGIPTNANGVRRYNAFNP